MAPAIAAAIIGGAASAGGGIISAIAQKKAAEEAADAQRYATDRAIEEQRQAYSDISPLWTPYSQAGLSALEQLAGGIQSGEFIGPELGDFTYGQTVQDFLDPSMAYQQEQAQRALEASAAMGGGLQSGSTLKALQNQAQDYGMQDWSNAYNRMTTDKNFAYQQFLNQFNTQRQNISDRYNQLASLTNLGTGAASALTGARTGTATNVGNLITQQGNANAAAAMAGPNAVSNIASSLTNAASQGYGIYQQAQQAQQLQNYLNSLQSNSSTGTGSTVVPTGNLGSTDNYGWGNA